MIEAMIPAIKSNFRSESTQAPGTIEQEKIQRG